MLKYIFLSLLILMIFISACENEEKIIPPPEIFLQIPEGGFDFDTDSVEIIEPKITYDINSLYSWFEDGNEIDNNGEKDYTFENRELGKYILTFAVETPYGDDTMDITVHSLDINTFEEFDNFNDDGYFNQPENGFHLFKYIQYPCEYIDESTDGWNGFAISELASTSDSETKGEFSVYSTSGADESDNFTIFKQVEDKSNNISFNDNEAHKVKSIAVNNCTRSYIYMSGGFNKKEGKDFFKLSINGLDESGSQISGPVEFLLADYRPEQTQDKYIIADWNTISLTELGLVHQLEFKLTSSRDDDPEFELPMYFCLDNLKVIE